MVQLEQGVRRLEAEAEAAQRGDEDVKRQAIRMINRLAFAANRSQWFSACELAVYLITGSMHFRSHEADTIYMARPMFLMRQCQRLLRGQHLEGWQLEAAPAELAAVDFAVVLDQEAAPSAPTLDPEAGDTAAAEEPHHEGMQVEGPYARDGCR